MPDPLILTCCTYPNDDVTFAGDNPVTCESPVLAVEGRERSGRPDTTFTQINLTPEAVQQVIDYCTDWLARVQAEEPQA